MKFYAGFALAMVLNGNYAKAQHSSQHATLGIKGGLNLYNIEGANADMKAGFNVGLLGHIHLTKRFGLQPEIMYSQQGAKSKIANIKSSINLNYINVPLMFQYMFDNGFRLQAGPQVGFLVTAKSKLNSTSTDIKNSYKTADVGIGAGLGYVNPSSGFGVDARYNLGLSKINKSGTTDLMNRGVQLGLFYLIQHKGK